MSPDTIANLERLLAAATKGPWRVEAFNEVVAGEPDYASMIIAGDGESILAQQISDTDAILITATKNELPALLATAKEVERLREALTNAEAKFREYEQMHLAKVRPHIQGVHNQAARAKADRNREMADMCAAALNGGNHVS